MNNLRNKVTLIGFLGNDPEIKTIITDKTLAKFSIATHETFVNGDGERVTTSTWHSIIAWGKLAELCGQLLKKGQEIVVEGKLIYLSFDDGAGVRRNITEIQMNEFVLVGRKPSDKSEEAESTLLDNELPSTEA